MLHLFVSIAKLIHFVFAVDPLLHRLREREVVLEGPVLLAAPLEVYNDV